MRLLREYFPVNLMSIYLPGRRSLQYIYIFFTRLKCKIFQLKVVQKKKKEKKKLYNLALKNKPFASLRRNL